MTSLRDQLRTASTDSLRSLLLSTPGATTGDAVHAVGSALDAQWWRVERTIRTETAYAHGAASRAAIRVLAEDNPGMMQRWTEYVDDLTGAPLDNRVGLDSLVLHGQIARPGELFTMPGDPRAGAMVGQQWEHPPNRPNDRAVLLPWMPRSGIPAYTMRAGNRVSVR